MDTQAKCTQCAECTFFVFFAHFVFPCHILALFPLSSLSLLSGMRSNSMPQDVLKAIEAAKSLGSLDLANMGLSDLSFLDAHDLSDVTSAGKHTGVGRVSWSWRHRKEGSEGRDGKVLI